MNTTADGRTWLDIVNSPEWAARELEWAAERIAYNASLSWWDKHDDTVKAWVGALAFIFIGMPLIGLAWGVLFMGIFAVAEANPQNFIACLIVGGMFLLGYTGWVNKDAK